MTKESFKTKAYHKLVENLLSVKVWFVLSVLGISTGLILIGKLGGSEWAAVNGGVISTICAMREVLKIEKIKNNDTETMP